MNSHKLIINLAVGLFATLFAVGLLALYIFDIRVHQRMKQADGWPKVRCTVIEAHQSFDSDSYYATYSYEVAGTTYQSEQLAFWPGNSDTPITEGSMYWGALNPDDPSEVFLQPDKRLPKLIPWVIYGWVIMSGIGFVQYLLVRCNLKPLRMSYRNEKKLLYSEM